MGKVLLGVALGYFAHDAIDDFMRGFLREVQKPKGPNTVEDFGE